MTEPVTPPLALIRHSVPDAAARVRTWLRERLEVLSSAARRARAGDDREAAHDVRVASRRLDAGLRLWQDALDPGAAREARRHLRRLRRRAGGLRDLEVHAEMLHARAGEWSGEQRLAVEALAARLDRRLPDAVRRTARATRKDRVRRIDTALARALAPLATSDSLPPPAIAPPDLEPFAGAARGTLASAIASGHDAEFHDARIAIKRWRYAVEALEAVFPAPERPGDTPLRGLQQALGTLQDIVALRVRIVRRAERLRTNGRTAEADALLAADATLAGERAEAIGAIERLSERRLAASGRPDAGASDQRRSTTPGV
jgi:CHAD domain-containing protein